MKPYLFTTTTRGRRRLRDYVIDLNREKNFNQIVNHFCVTFRKAARAGKSLPALMVEVHSPSELKQIMATNLRRMAIDFENAPADVISGRSDYLNPIECMDWWLELVSSFFGDDDNDDSSESAPEDEDLKGITPNVRDQMREVLDEIDGRN